MAKIMQLAQPRVATAASWSCLALLLLSTRLDVYGIADRIPWALKIRLDSIPLGAFRFLNNSRRLRLSIVYRMQSPVPQIREETNTNNFKHCTLDDSSIPFPGIDSLWSRIDGQAHSPSIVLVDFSQRLGCIDHLNDIDPILECADWECDKGDEIRVRKWDSTNIAYHPVR
jgi:hypothetical protein